MVTTHLGDNNREITGKSAVAHCVRETVFSWSEMYGTNV